MLALHPTKLSKDNRRLRRQEVTLLKKAFSRSYPAKGYRDALALENHTLGQSIKTAHSLEGRRLKSMSLKQR
jgi:hypothetical protein